MGGTLLELSDLSRFIAISQADSLGKAAAALRLAPSTLSARIKALEGELGFPLFERARRGLVPNGSGRWLFRESLNILHAEAFARRAVQGGVHDPHPLAIEIEMEFTIGRFTQAVGHAMEAAALMVPGACFTVRWRDQWRTSRGASDDPAAAVGLRYKVLGSGAAAGLALASDTLVLLRGRHAAAFRGRPTPVKVPRIQGVPARWLRALLRAGLGGTMDLTFTDDDLASVEAMLEDQPDEALLVPASVLSGRVRSLGTVVSLQDPALCLPIVASLTRRTPAAQAFVRCLGDALAGPEAALVAHPGVTSRQLDYFDALRRTHSVTKAARQSGVAQPAVTEQLAKLEATLEEPLFDRSRTGLTLTEAGQRFDKAVALLNAARHEVVVKRSGVPNTARRLQFGVLPAVGAGGFLISRVARAVAAWRSHHPGLQLRVVEQPNARLQEMVRRGTLDLAIITTRSPRMARFDLGSTEALALVMNPDCPLKPPAGPVEFDVLAHLPLVLPTTQFGLRQLVDDAGRARGIRLRPEIEVDSLSMCVALVREGRLATILPASDVAQQVAAGQLSVHTIHKPRIVRTPQVIYSADRRLTDAERDLVRLLRTELAAPEGRPDA